MCIGWLIENAIDREIYRILGLFGTEEVVHRHATADVGVLIPLHSTLCKRFL
jgi:hypothetical protein